MGLGSGLVLFIVCLTGTIYTFRAEIERWMEPDKYYSQNNPASAPLAVDSVIAIIEREQQGKVTSIVVPGNREMNWQVSVKKEAPAKKRQEKDTKAAPGGRPKTLFVNPATGAVEGEQGGSTSEFFTTVMQLHRWLLMEDSGGKIIVGVATLIFVFLILSGLVIWFPAKLRYWKQGFTIKTKAGWKRINHDLHNTLGFYSFLLLLVMALTGLCWSFEWYRDGVSEVLGAKVFRGRNEKPLLSKDSLGGMTASYQSMLAESNRLFPYAGNSRLTIPEGGSTAVTITKSATGFFSSAGSDKAQFDRYSGTLLKKEAFSDKALNVQIADSIRQIHTGEIFGTFSKIIYFIVCLIATSLPVTGTMIWVNKMKKKKKRSKFVRQSEPELA